MTRTVYLGWKPYKICVCGTKLVNHGFKKKKRNEKKKSGPKGAV